MAADGLNGELAPLGAWRRARAALDHPNVSEASISTIARIAAEAPDDVSPVFLALPRDDLDGDTATALLEAAVLRADGLSAAAAWLAAHPDIGEAGVAALEHSADPRLHRIASKHRAHAKEHAGALPGEADVLSGDSDSDDPPPAATDRSMGL